MARSALARQLRTLRTQIELLMVPPSLILFTSAKADDGSTIAAMALADGLSASGHRVAFIDGGELIAGAEAAHARFSRYRLAELAAAGTRPNDAVAALVEKMRREYDYTIVDAPQFVESTPSMLLANVADAVLLAMQIGRARGRDDEFMMTALQLAQARVLGVVGATEAAIREFARESQAVAVPERFTRLKPSWKTVSPATVEP